MQRVVYSSQMKIAPSTKRSEPDESSSRKLTCAGMEESMESIDTAVLEEAVKQSRKAKSSDCKPSATATEENIDARSLEEPAKQPCEVKSDEPKPVGTEEGIDTCVLEDSVQQPLEAGCGSPTKAHPTLSEKVLRELPKPPEEAWSSRGGDSLAREVAKPDGEQAARCQDVVALKEQAEQLATIRAQNEALLREKQQMAERLEVFESALQLDDSPTNDECENDDENIDPLARLSDKTQRLHSQLVLEAVGLRKEVAALKKKKWVMRAMLAKGGEREASALEHDLAELRSAKRQAPETPCSVKSVEV